MPFELPRIKVCGLTTVADVAVAVAAGADALGFVHYAASARHVTSAQARELVAGVRCLTVAVVVDATPVAAARFLQASGLDAIQLCGRENPSDWTNFDAPILRRVAVDTAGASEQDAWSAIAAGFVLDHPNSPGGSGLGVDLQLAAGLARRGPCLLAGGLDALNVSQRVRSVEPHGVDASSRLEREPGIKEPQLVRSFVASARRTLDQCAENRA